MTKCLMHKQVCKTAFSFTTAICQGIARYCILSLLVQEISGSVSLSLFSHVSALHRPWPTALRFSGLDGPCCPGLVGGEVGEGEHCQLARDQRGSRLLVELHSQLEVGRPNLDTPPTDDLLHLRTEAQHREVVIWIPGI